MHAYPEPTHGTATWTGPLRSAVATLVVRAVGLRVLVAARQRNPWAVRVCGSRADGRVSGHELNHGYGPTNNRIRRHGSEKIRPDRPTHPETSMRNFECHTEFAPQMTRSIDSLASTTTRSGRIAHVLA
jgi:hypothetical protein